MILNLSVKQLINLDKHQLQALYAIDKAAKKMYVYGLDESRQDNPIGVIIKSKLFDNYEYLINRKGITGFTCIDTTENVNMEQFLTLSQKYLKTHPSVYHEEEKTY